MSAPQLIVKTFAFKATPLYTCKVCGKTGAGSTVSCEFEGLHILQPSELAYKVLLEEEKTSNSHMPEGWAGYGKGEHRCPACKS